MALTYYLTIDGVDGGSTVPGHVGAFAIDDFSFDVSAIVDALTGTGGGSGRAIFSPLTVDLTQASGLTTLLGDVASGSQIRSIELQGVTTSGDTVYDLRLSNVFVASIQDLRGDFGAFDRLTFDYSHGAISLTTTPINDAGAPGTPDTLSWDVAHNASLNGAILPPPVASSVDTGGAGAQTYYLTIDGVDGGSQASGHAGAFVVSDFKFDVSALIDALTGTGGGSGTTTFSPLTVNLALGSGLTTLLGDLASGEQIRSIELQGVTTSGQAVYDLRLSNVFVTRVDTGIGELGSLSFDYSHGAVSLTTTPIGPGGAPGTPDTLSWDVANNASLHGVPLAAPVAGSADTGGGGAETYYLTIDGVDGGSTVDGHAGAFVIGNFNFDVSALVDAATGTGAGSGRATFSPLTVTLSLGSGLTTLLGDVASGEQIRSIQLQGVTSGAHPETVYDLRLSDVFITRVHDSSSGLDSLTFDYSHGAVSLTTTGTGPSGAPLSDTLSWDVLHNTSLNGVALAPPVASSADTGGAGAQTYYLTIDGVDGGSTASGHAGAFVIGDFSFDVSALVSALTGTGGGSNTTTFSPLNVNLSLGSGLTTLLGDVASGETIRSIQLQGVSTTGQTVYDLRLSDVFVTRVYNGNGLDSLSFDYSHGAVSLTTTGTGPTGAPLSDTLSWDVLHNASLNGVALAPPVAGSADTGGGGAQTYYLTIDGVDGGSTASGHAGAFVIKNFNFEVSALIDALTGTGGGSGRATFSPLTVHLALGSGLTTLLGDVASGKLIKSIELQGVSSTGQTVYDLTLSNVFVTMVNDASTGFGNLSFDYSHGAVSLTTTGTGPTGTPVSDTMSWDVANNASLHGAILPPPVASSVDTGGAGAQTYYLTIDGVDGGSTVEGHAGAFVIGDFSGFSFNVSALVDAATGTGAGSGRAMFSPLFVNLTLGSGLTTLLGDVAGGETVRSIDVQGVTTSGQTVYDLRLTNVFITRVADRSSGIDSLSFDYSHGTVSLTTTPISSSGAPGTPDTLAWDVANNRRLLAPDPIVTDTTTPGERVAHGTTVTVGTATPGSPGDTLTLTQLSGPPGALTLSNGIVSFAVAASATGSPIAAPVPSSTDTGGGGAQTWYLTIDGVDGGSTVSGHAGAFVIGDFNFDVSALVSALSGTGGASGRATFSPLTVNLPLSSGLTTLLGNVASGEQIRSIELQGATTSGQTVYDLRLSNVFITRVHDSSSGLDSLSLDYSNGAVSLTTTAIGPTGAPSSDTLSWDVAHNASLNGVPLAPPVASSTDTGGAGARTYYLTIDGVDGGSTVERHVGAFAIDDFSFDVTAVVDALTGTGGGSGRTIFSPLTVDLTQASGLTTLLGDVASGRQIRSIELQGVTNSGQTVYDLRLSDVFVASVQDLRGDFGAVDRLTFDYSHGAVSLTTTAIGPSGAPQSDTLSWDVAHNASLNGVPLAPPVAGSVDTGGGGAQTYYLTIDGVDGGSEHAGAFAISDFNFDVSALIDAATGTGGGSGTTTFSPLTVNLTLGSGLTTLLGDVASGEQIRSIELQGVTTSGQTVYDLRLSNVFITTVHDSGNGIDSLVFDYSHGAVSLTTTPIDSSGAPGTPDTLSWDVLHNASLNDVPLAPPVPSSTDTGGAGAQTWYLTIDGVDGGSTVSGHAGAFVIGNFSFDVSALVDAATGTGGGSGRATFSPLTVTLSLGSGLTTLLGDVASGVTIRSIELQGVTSSGQTVYNLTLSNVFVTRVHDSSNGLDSLSFDYSHGAVSLTTTAIGPTGAPQSDTLSWDVANNVSLHGASLPPPVAGSVNTGGAGAQTWYLTIDGVDGGSTVSGHAGAFVIGDFSFDVSALVSAATGTGGGSGRAMFSPLTVDLTFGSGLTTLLGDVANGRFIRSIELQGVSSTGQTVYDLTLRNVFITTVHDGISGLDSLSFDYSHGAVSLTTTAIGPTGAPQSDTLSWDVANNVSLHGASLPPPVVSSVDTGGAGAQTWYLTIDGVDGGSTVEGHVGAFVIGDFSFDVGALVSALTGTGGGSGRAIFAPLTVSLSLGSGLTTLLGDVANGTQIRSIELQGVTTSGQTVYDLRLSNVFVTRVHDSSGLDRLSFDYSHGAVSLTTTPIGSSGAPGTPVTLSWDVANNRQLADLSGNVAFSYQISDQHGHVSGVISDTLTIDPGPSVIDTTTAGQKLVHGTTVTVGTVTPGLPGDTLTLHQLSGPAGALTLANGVVSFTAPASGGPMTFSYQIGDQVGDLSAVITDTLGVDAGPTVTDLTSPGQKVAHGTTVTVGTVTPGLPGDTLTLHQLTGAAGALTLDSNGNVNFAVPANAGPVSFSYQISDQFGDLSPIVSDTLTVDPGPTAGNAHLYASPGQSVDLTSLLLSLDTPGLAGDTLTLSAVGTTGTLGTVSLNNGDLVYTGPTTGSSDLFTYTVSDQLQESATASVSVSLVSATGNVALTGSGNVVITAGGSHTVTGGSGGNFVSLGGGNDTVSLGGDNNTVVLGDGNDSVTLSGKNNIVRLGNGNDSVTAGDGSTITLGNGNDLVYVGANSTVVVGNGNNSVFAGANDTITLGTGHNLVAFGLNGPLPIGNEVVTGFGTDDTLRFNKQLLAKFEKAMADAKQVLADTVITIDPGDSVTLKGVAMTSLTASNFKFG